MIYVRRFIVEDVGEFGWEVWFVADGQFVVDLNKHCVLS